MRASTGMPIYAVTIERAATTCQVCRCTVVSYVVVVPSVPPMRKASRMTSEGLANRPLTLPSSRIDLVRDQIRSAILARHFKPGQALVEAELARMMGVSKTPVREALKVLASSGLVTSIPYRGVFVREVDESYVASVYDVRVLLEPEAVRRSVTRGNDAGLNRAAVHLEDARRAAEAGDRAQMSMLNRQFHADLYAACGSELLSDILDNLRDRAALVSVASWETAPTWGVEWAEHRAILAAALAGDGDRAAELLSQHFQSFLARTLARMA
jgi:DNA-binding GntR family transcriptional regulator